MRGTAPTELGSAAATPDLAVRHGVGAGTSLRSVLVRHRLPAVDHIVKHGERGGSVIWSLGPRRTLAWLEGSGRQQRNRSSAKRAGGLGGDSGDLPGQPAESGTERGENDSFRGLTENVPQVPSSPPHGSDTGSDIQPILNHKRISG